MGVRVCRVAPSHSPPDRPTSGYRTIRPTWAHTDNYPLRGYKWESKFDGSPRRPLLPVVRVVFAGASSDKALSPLRDGSWGRPLLRAHSSTAHVPRLRRRLGLPGVLLARASSDWPSALFATAPGVGAHSSTCARSQAATLARIRHFLGCGRYTSTPLFPLVALPTSGFTATLGAEAPSALKLTASTLPRHRIPIRRFQYRRGRANATDHMVSDTHLI